MLRISEIEGAKSHAVLKLEGRLVGAWVEELRIACETLFGRKQLIKLDLADVSYVDRKGVALLRQLESRDVMLEGCSPFVTEELKGL